MSLQKTYRWQARMTEHVAAALLWSKGYGVQGLNRRICGVEVDVLARRGSTWVVAEVKVRRTPQTDWENAIAPHQQQRLRRVVAHLSQKHNAPARLDLVLFCPHFPYIRHYKNI